MIRFKEYVLPQYMRFRRQGQRAALVTLVDMDGSSPRPVGSQMAVAEDGSALGNLSGGCAEAAIVAEAVEAIGTGKNRVLRLGQGSPFIDIRLPCGAGIDILINVQLDADLIGDLVDTVAGRASGELIQNLQSGQASVVPAPAGGPPVRLEGDSFSQRYDPLTRVVAIGRGPILVSLTQLAEQLDMETRAVSPDTITLSELGHDRDCVHLTGPGDFDAGDFDAQTAAVLLFHEHEWEPPIIHKVLATNVFYLGVLGSRKTHSQRVEDLRALGASAGDLKRLRAPIGLDIGARTPHEIALATLAEIVSVQRSSAPAA